MRWPPRPIPDEHARAAEHDLLAAERHAADPPVSYAEIGARLGIPAGSIGPTRHRRLNKLRRHPAITALINANT